MTEIEACIENLRELAPLHRLPGLATAADLLARLRLERDMLGLNPPGKGSVVFPVSDEHGEVVAVTWPKTQSGSDRPLRFPSYYTEAAEAVKEK